MDTALDIVGANAELVIARFLAGEFKYGAAYSYHAGSRIKPDMDFEETARFFERVETYFGISSEQLQAFFKSSNLPESAKLSVKAILGQN